MGATCFNCKNPLPFNLGTKVSRNEECPNCRRDVRCCYNCMHYDKNSYNECHEPQADRVVEKDRSNFCDYFAFGTGSLIGGGQSKDDVYKKLNDLFK